MSDYSCKRGRLLITSTLYYTQPERVQAILNWIEFLPCRVELLAMTDQFELLGYSSHFSVLPEAQITPTYDLEIHVDEDGELVSVVAALTPLSENDDA
jgi:hypothetical protein